MGHANLSNLSRLFTRLLFAKGKISIDDAIACAQKRGEQVQASEGGYSDEGMLSYAFGEIVQHLASPDGSGYRYSEDWPGPFIEPVLKIPTFCPRGGRETMVMTELLRQCSEVIVSEKRLGILQNQTLFDVCADAIAELDGTEQQNWAERMRAWPRLQYILGEWRDGNWDAFDDEENWRAFDSIKWQYLRHWRMRYIDIPLLANVTN